MTNRALVLGALASDGSAVRRPLRSRDTELMAAGLRALGATVTDAGDDWVVTGLDAAEGGDVAVDVGNAGTVARFLPAVAALTARTVSFDGDPRIRERPIAPLLTGLRALGADVDDGGRGTFPVTVRGRGGLPGGRADVDASESSQLVSGLLLVGPRCADGLELVSTGALPSRPHVAMTVAMMRAAGAQVAAEGGSWRVAPGDYAAPDVVVEPDLSGAAPFVAAAVVAGGTVRIPGWPRSTTQPGAALVGLLELMGARCTLDDDGLSVQGDGGVSGVVADLGDCGELLPVLAALAALAHEPSRFTGVAHLRRHETDRLAALARELGNLGSDVEELPDGLAITPRPLHAGTVETYDDHRIAMAAALLGLAVPGLLVSDVATTAKTMPDFTTRWAAMLGAG